MARHRTTVVEFLQSGRLSDSLCFLQHEHGGNGRPAGHEGEENPRQRLTVENAARLALLVARTFVDFGAHNDPSSLRLDDLHVDFQQRDRAAAGGGGGRPSQDLAPSNPSSRQTIFIGIGFFSPTEVTSRQGGEERQQQLQPGQENSGETPMQILGRFLRAIFFQGQLPPLESSTTDPKAEEVDSGHRRASRPRTEDGTVFSQLVDAEALPISVCRLLSDLIDRGPMGKAETPFVSFQDVFQDLEQMITRPRIFLHDSYFPHREQRAPAFGKGCFGRRDEVKVVMETADRMERSDKNLGGGDSRSAGGIQAVFVSGIAGSGKSHLARAVAETLRGCGWIVAEAKFERGKSYASGGLVSSMFDGVVAHLVRIKEGGKPADVEYCRRVSKSIRGSIGRESLSWLVGFLPSLSSLLDAVTGEGQDGDIPLGYRLVHCLSVILKAVLERGRFIMIVADDLQWADETLILIREVLLNIADFEHVGRRCLFVGMFRQDEETGDDGPFIASLRQNPVINAADIQLSGLPKDGVIEIVMTELRLPRRIVVGVADAVHKKTSGHALYVVELLNSLLAKTIIAYSPRKHCYVWDQERIDFVQISENVAGLIGSNLGSLSRESLCRLQIVSCFGMQADISLLQILENFEGGMIASLDEFVQRGILDRAGPMVRFAHDLILRAVYEGMPFARRASLHLGIGRLLASTSARGDPSGATDRPFFAGNRVTSCLLSVACDQVNSAGVDPVANDGDRRVEFAGWNLGASVRMVRDSNFTAALHYFEHGVAFLGAEEGGWRRDPRLFVGLHECAVSASFALGRTDDVVRHADALTGRAPLVETLEVQATVLKSLAMAFRHKEGVPRGFEILRRLGFDVPISPTDEMASEAMVDVDGMASRHDADGIVGLCDKSGKSVCDVVKVIGAFQNFFWEETSLLTLLSCESIKYSLQNGVCLESATAFAMYAMLKIRHDDFLGGKWWADASRAIIQHYKDTKRAVDPAPAVSARNILYWAVDVWFTPAREIGSKSLEHYVEATKAGLVDDAINSLMGRWSYLLYGGENLSIVSQSSLRRFREIAKYSQFYAKSVICDYVYLMELTGKYEDYFAELEGASSLEDVQVEAESNNIHMLTYHIKVTNVLRAYWKGDYLGAEENALMDTTSKLDHTSPLFSILHCFFGGLVAFHLYRTLGDGARLSKGRESLKQMVKWAENSAAVFGTMWHLLTAEHAASIKGRSEDVKKHYNDAIRSAQDLGNVHELALAHELLGNYLAAREQPGDGGSDGCFERAFVYYQRWGATTVAERIFRDRNLDAVSVAGVELQMGNNSKRKLPGTLEGLNDVS